MASMDIFKQDAFSMMSMLRGIDKVPYLPTLLGDLNVFTAQPVRTEVVWIEQRDGVLTVLPTSPRGGPGTKRTSELRTARSFRTPRIRINDTITASEVANIREFGMESEFQQVQAEVARRMTGPTGLMRQIEYTWEHYRLGAIQGIVFDSDGVTELYDWFTEFGITPAAPVTFVFSGTTADGTIRTACNEIVRAMMRAAKGAWINGRTYAAALCGDQFYDDLTGSAETRQTYLNWQAAAELRGGAAFEAFQYGGITFINYRGSDDGTTIAIASDEAKFFPVNSTAFEVAYSPGESFEFVNTPGQPIYPAIIPDLKRNEFVEIEASSYPLFICTRPEMLQFGTL